MSADASKDQAFYIQDVLPLELKDLFKEPEYNVDKALLFQIKVVSKCKKTLVNKRSTLIQAIANEYVKENYGRCGILDEEFLSMVQEDIVKDEVEARRKVLGEQESVEMFKAALSSDLITEDYLDSARAYRDNMTQQLRSVVEAREVVLIALEIIRRLPTAQHSPKNAKIEAMKCAYINAKELYVSELELLEKLTVWKNNPDMYITDDDEFFAFFNDGYDLDYEDKTKTEQNGDNAVVNEAQLPTPPPLSKPFDEERKKLVHFKLTKVDHIDNEFDMLTDLAYDILKHEVTVKDILSDFQHEARVYTKGRRTHAGIHNYVSYLQWQYPKLKIKVTTKGYNFSLKVMRRTKSVMSLTLLTNLLDSVQDIPEQILRAQEKFSVMSNAVKRICGMYGRCSMAFQKIIHKERELDQEIRNVPKVNYAESLRVSGHFAANMKELRRLDEMKDNIKRMADGIFEDVVMVAEEQKKKKKDL